MASECLLLLKGTPSVETADHADRNVVELSRTMLQSPPARISPTASLHLDFVRGLAAFVVFGGHVRALFFQSYSALSSPSILIKAVYALTGLGHEAVVVFFALSGLFVGSSITRSLSTGNWSIGDYALARLTRLLIVLWPALLLGAGLDSLGCHLWPDAGVYRGGEDFNHVVTGSVQDRLSAPILLGNAVFLQTVTVPTLGSNGPLWSLANEFWYYVLFPAILLTVNRATPASHRAGSAVLLIAMGGWLPTSLLPGFAVWLFGAAVPHIPHRSLYSSRMVWAGGTIVSLALLGLALGLSRSRQSPQAVSDLVLGVTSSFVFWFILDCKERTHWRLYSALSMWCSKVSYTLYVVHFPLLVFAQAATCGDRRLAPGLLSCLGVALVAAMVVGYAVAVWAAFERFTPAVRGKLRRLFAGPRDVSVGPTPTGRETQL